VIHVYCYELNEGFQKKSFDKLLCSLPNEIQIRIRRFRNWEDQQASLIGKLLIRKGLHDLGSYNDDPLNRLQYNSFQKPFIEGNINFSISHSGRFVVCAISDINMLGIDIEQIRSIDVSPFKTHMTPNEWNEINKAIDKTAAFYSYWTKKEAVVKAIGKGLNIPLKSFSIRENKTTIDNQTWYLKKLNVGNENICHLALDEKVKQEQLVFQKIGEIE